MPNPRIAIIGGKKVFRRNGPLIFRSSGTGALKQKKALKNSARRPQEYSALIEDDVMAFYSLEIFVNKLRILSVPAIEPVKLALANAPLPFNKQ